MENSKVITRGIQVLEYMAAHDTSSVAEIAHALALSPAAVYRVLESLAAGGYVRRNAFREPYRLTLKLATIARSMSMQAVVANLAGPVLRELSATTGWPTLLGYVDELEYVVIEAAAGRELTDIPRLFPGKRFPAFRRSGGIICVVGKPAPERRRFAERTNARYGDEVLVKDITYLQREYERAARQGYVVFDALRTPFASAAVPITFSGEDVIFGLEMQFLPEQVMKSQRVSSLVTKLKMAGSRIAALYAAFAETQPTARNN